MSNTYSAEIVTTADNKRQGRLEDGGRGTCLNTRPLARGEVPHPHASGLVLWILPHEQHTPAQGIEEKDRDTCKATRPRDARVRTNETLSDRSRVRRNGPATSSLGKGSNGRVSR